MSATSVPISRPAPDWIRNALVRAFGWRGLLWQHDLPTYDRWRWLRRHLEPGPHRTLDAGSGSGVFVIYAAAIGNEAVGISFDQEANAMAARRADLLGLGPVQFRTADLRHLDRLTGLGAFDQIICLETIEHLIHDRKLVADLARLLRPGGRLFLTTPTVEHRPLVGEKLSSSEDGGHVRWGYTVDQLRRLMTLAGLTMVSCEYLSGLVTQQVTNVARLVEPAIGIRAAWAVTAPLRLLRVFDRAITRLIGGRYLALGVIGVKR